MSGRREFYIGYRDRAPRGVGRRVAAVTAALVTGGLVLAVVLSRSQAPFAPAWFEYGTVRPLSGHLRADPVPSLLVERPGRAGPGAAAVSRYLLTVPGKAGADDRIREWVGQSVSLEGTLIYREGHTMVELAEAPTAVAGADPAPEPPLVSFGTVALRGEIVDAKCYLGVMNPGAGKVHRGCAARCLSGGAPPMLVVRDRAGGERHVLLVGPDGSAVNRALLPYVAEPVELVGELTRTGEWWTLYVDPGTLRRL